MKKYFLFCLFALFSCVTGKEVQIVCSTTPVEALTKGVVGDIPGYKVSSVLSSAAGCPHDYALVPADVRRLSKAQVIVLNGLGMDEMFRIRSKAHFVDSSAGVSAIPASGKTEGEKHSACHHPECEKGHHHHHHDGENRNGHLFAAPSTAAQAAESICCQLSKLYPGDAAAFRKNTDRFAGQLKALALRYGEAGKRFPAEHRKICAGHDIFAYFCRDLGFRMEFVISVHDGVEPSAAAKARLIRSMRKDAPLFIALESQASSKAADSIARETGVKILKFRLQPEKGEPSELLRNMEENLKTVENFRKN